MKLISIKFFFNFMLQGVLIIVDIYLYNIYVLCIKYNHSYHLYNFMEKFGAESLQFIVENKQGGLHTLLFL